MRVDGDEDEDLELNITAFVVPSNKTYSEENMILLEPFNEIVSREHIFVMYEQIHGTYLLQITNEINDTIIIDIIINGQGSIKGLSTGAISQSMVHDDKWNFFKFDVHKAGFMDIQISQCWGKLEAYWTDNPEDVTLETFSN